MADSKSVRLTPRWSQRGLRPRFAGKSRVGGCHSSRVAQLWIVRPIEFSNTMTRQPCLSKFAAQYTGGVFETIFASPKTGIKSLVFFRGVSAVFMTFQFLDFCLHRFLCFTMYRPNTALEPTAITPVRLRFGRRFTDVPFRRDSAFGR